MSSVFSLLLLPIASSFHEGKQKLYESSEIPAIKRIFT